MWIGVRPTIAACLAGLLVACDRPPPPAAGSGPPAAAVAAASYHPIVSVKELMNEVLEPAADAYWNAVGSTTDGKGTTEFAPKTDSAWILLRNHGTMIAEAGNLLMMERPAKNAADWMGFSRTLITAGTRARDAAIAHDKTRVFDVGAEVYDACVNCHTKYMVPKYEAPGIPK